MSNIENFAQADFGESMVEGFEGHPEPQHGGIGEGSYEMLGKPHPANTNEDGYLTNEELTDFRDTHVGGGPQIYNRLADTDFTNTNLDRMTQDEATRMAAAEAIGPVAENNDQVGAGSPANNGGANEVLVGAGNTVGAGEGPPNEANDMAQATNDMTNEAGSPANNGANGMLLGGGNTVGAGSPENFSNIQTGGDGFRLGVGQEMVGGQAVVDGYDSELATCGGYGEELNNTNDALNQVGGGSPFNFIMDPATNTSFSIFSKQGKNLLKKYVKAFKQMQSGGAALLDGVDPDATGALYDGIQNAGAENFPNACERTYDATQDVWMHTQVGGGECQNKNCGPNCKC